MTITLLFLSLLSAVVIYICFGLLRSHQQYKVIICITSSSVLHPDLYQNDLRWAASQGCQPTPVLDTGSWPLGINLISEAFKAAREQRLLRMFVDVVNRTGYTFEQRLLGTSGIDTIDPVNLEAVLSKQFEGLSTRHHLPTDLC